MTTQRIQLSEKEAEWPLPKVTATIKDYLDRHGLILVGQLGTMDATRTFDVTVEKKPKNGT